jgi:hypothetical protein
MNRTTFLLLGRKKDESMEQSSEMKADDLNFDTAKSIHLSAEALGPGSKAAVFSTFLWAIASGDIATAEPQITHDIEWGLMPYNKVLKGRGEVIPWLKAATADQKGAYRYK